MSAMCTLIRLLAESAFVLSARLLREAHINFGTVIHRMRLRRLRRLYMYVRARVRAIVNEGVLTCMRVNTRAS